MPKSSRILIALLWGLVGAVGVLPALFSVMIVGAPGADERPATVALSYAILPLPIVCFIAATKTLALPETLTSVWPKLWALLPLVNLAVGLLAYWWIVQFQGGKFNG